MNSPKLPNKVSPFKIGIVIQGPIKSVGVTGESASQVEFNSSQYILSQYKLARSLNCEAVVSTWRIEDVSQLITIPSQDILKLDEYKHRFGNSFNNPDFSGKNKFRQFYSSLKGTEKLVVRGCNFIVKIRTDQLIDLSLLIQYINSCHCDLIEEKIFLPFLDPTKPNYVDDFYFCGMATAMLDFSREFLSSREIHQNVHRDIFYKWVRFRNHNRGKRSQFTQYYPKINSMTKSQFDLIEYGWKECFGALPSEVWSTLQWRGYNFGFFDSPRKEGVRFSDSLSTLSFDDFCQKFKEAPWQFKLDTISILTYFFSSRVENFVRRVRDKILKKIRRV